MKSSSNIDKKFGMTQGEIGAMLKNLENIQLKLNEAAGPVVAVETRMRLIAELYEPVSEKVKELVAVENKTRKKGRHKSEDYWDCDLQFLDKAIDEVFHDVLKPDERQKVKEFRPLRNSLIHANFVELMSELGIPPAGREIISTDGKRNTLKPADIKEAIISIDKKGLGAFQIRANEVIFILDELIRSLANSH